MENPKFIVYADSGFKALVGTISRGKKMRRRDFFTVEFGSILSELSLKALRFITKIQTGLITH